MTVSRRRFFTRKAHGVHCCTNRWANVYNLGVKVEVVDKMKNFDSKPIRLKEI